MENVKKAGDLLSLLFNEQFDFDTLKSAKVTAGLFSSWHAITEELKIPSAADHSRIRELERGILLIEAGHPGWVQLLQTKQNQLLNLVQRKYPELNIRGVSFCLSRDTFSFAAPRPEDRRNSPPASVPAGAADQAPSASVITESSKAAHESIETLRKILQKRNRNYPGK